MTLNMETFIPNRQLFTLFKAVLLLAWTVIPPSLSCGGFYSTVLSGVITTPNYPSPYPHNTRCIWVFEAPSFNQVAFHIEAFNGQEGTTASYACHDYVEIRNGTSTSEVIFATCASTTGQTVLAGSRWLWVLFSSDGSQASTGLKANYSSSHVGNAVESIPNPLSSCKTHEFSCSNRQCISNSYRCDGYPDCGCADGGCDEDGCGGIDISYGARLAMGIGIGVGLFISICMISLLWERRHNWAKLNHKEKEKEKIKNKS